MRNKFVRLNYFKYFILFRPSATMGSHSCVCVCMRVDANFSDLIDQNCYATHSVGTRYTSRNMWRSNRQSMEWPIKRVFFFAFDKLASSGVLFVCLLAFSTHFATWKHEAFAPRAIPSSSSPFFSQIQTWRNLWRERQFCVCHFVWVREMKMH